MACYSSILGKIIIRHVVISAVLSGQSRDGGCCGGLSQGREEVAAGADIVDGSSTNSARWKHKRLGLVVPVQQRASQVALTKVGIAVQLRSRDEREKNLRTRVPARVVERLKVDRAQGRDRKKQERDATKGAI